MHAWTTEDLRRLRILFSAYYPGSTDISRIVADSGINIFDVDLSGSANNKWYNALEYARPRGKIESLLAVAARDNPDTKEFILALNGRPPRQIEGQEADWRGTTDRAKLEKIIGSQSTLVPVSYLEIGALRARAVVRILLKDGSSGSGFLTRGNIVVTNHHVLPDRETAREAVVQFNYQMSVFGSDSPVDEYHLQPDDFFRSCSEHDWSAVRVEGNPAKVWGVLDLNSKSVPVDGDRINIIQHAGGGQKQVSCLANIVVFVGLGRLQYLTDTLPGSSGSPVFDRNWNVVAVHHSGGWLEDPSASSKKYYLRNEGILIDQIRSGIGSPPSTEC